MAQLAAEGRRAHDAELATLKIGLVRDSETLKSISAERDDLLAFKLSCEGLPEQVTLIQGEIKNLERAMEETKESLAARRARAREVKQAKQDLIGSYRASASHMKKKLLAFSDGFDCGCLTQKELAGEKERISLINRTEHPRLAERVRCLCVGCDVTWG